MGTPGPKGKWWQGNSPCCCHNGYLCHVLTPSPLHSALVPCSLLPFQVTEALLDHEAFLGHLALKGTREKKETKVNTGADVLEFLKGGRLVLNRAFTKMPRQHHPEHNWHDNHITTREKGRGVLVRGGKGEPSW